MSDRSSANHKILIVEDDHDLLGAIRTQFEALGFEVREATDGRTALAMIMNQRFDVVLSDQNMPGLSGLALLSQTRARFPDLAFVLMTAADSSWREAAIELGATEVLFKPFSIETAIKLVSGLLGVRAKANPERLRTPG